jgi:hypothetical protein
MSEQQTAVEWLAECVANQEAGNGRIYLETSWLEEWLTEAKAMEKEQIIFAYMCGVNDAPFYEDKDHIDAERYYNETYKNE